MQRSRPVAFALLLIGVGVVLLLEQAGAIPEDVSVWPIVLIGAGAFLFVERLVSGGGGGGYVVSMVLVAIGLAFLLDDLGATDDEAVLVPLVVIGVGIGLMLSAMPSRGGPAPEQASVALAGAVGATVRVNHGAGRVLDKPDAAAEFSEEQVLTEMRRKNIRLYRYGNDNIVEQAPGSFKDVSQVNRAVAALRLATPVVRLRPVAVLKG